MKEISYQNVKIFINEDDILLTNVVYKLTFPNNKSYVGLTTIKCLDRIKRHIREKSDYKKSRAIKKYKTFNVEILYIGDDLKNKEIYYIDLYNTLTNGYNSTRGGDGVNNLSDEAKKKIRLKNTGLKRSLDVCERQSELKKGTIHTEETKNKISISNIGKHSKPIYQIDLIDGTIIKEFNSVYEANKFFNKKLKSTSIKNCIYNLSKSAYGFGWVKK